MDIDVLFSDGTSTPLRDIEEEDFYLTINTMGSNAIAFAPVAGSTYSRIIAVGNGKGQLLKTSLELPGPCEQKNGNTIASALAFVHVEFDERNSQDVSNPNQNKIRTVEIRANKNAHSVDIGDLTKLSPNIALQDDYSRIASESSLCELIVQGSPSSSTHLMVKG